MFASSTVPIAPHPVRIKEGQHCGSLLPLPGCKCKSESKSLLAIAKAASGAVVPPWLALPDGESPSRRDLVPPNQVSVQDIESARVAIVLVIAGMTIFRRFVLRLILAIIVVAVGLGLLVLLQAIHR
jgi:hypothetical protein